MLALTNVSITPRITFSIISAGIEVRLALLELMKVFQSFR